MLSALLYLFVLGGAEELRSYVKLSKHSSDRVGELV